MEYMELYRNSFLFHAIRFEEWSNGQCIGNGVIETDIMAEASKSNIRFYISSTGNLKISSSSVFEFSDESEELILDRIIYSHEVLSADPTEPVECQLFITGSTVSGIRFTMLNPLRVIEFYGTVIEIGQPYRHVYKEQDKIKTAESIISNLKTSHRYDADKLMEVAVNHFELYSDASTPEQIKGVVESLKLFVEVYKMLTKMTFDENKVHMLLPKVYFFISICNLKLCNISQAYAVAKEGLVKVDEVIRDSVFENLPPNLIGADDLRDIIIHIENNYPGVKNSSSNAVNPCIIDTGIIESIEKNSPEILRDISTDDLEIIHDKLCSLQASLNKLFDKTGNRKVLDAKNDIDKYKYPLYAYWESFDLYLNSKVDPQVVNSPNYQAFKTDIQAGIHNLLCELEESSLFHKILRDDDVTERLVSIYNYIIDKTETLRNEVVNNELMPQYTNIPAIFRRQTGNSLSLNGDSQIIAELPDLFVYKSNEHQRYEYETPVMGPQKCLRTIIVELNKNGCDGYDIQPGDGYIVKIFNNETANAQMSAKPMRFVQSTDSFIELRGYPLYAITPFGWQPVDYSSYGFFIHYTNGIITHCDLHMRDRNVRIEYRYTKLIESEL